MNRILNIIVNSDALRRWLMMVFSGILVVMVIIMLTLVNSAQGNAHVVNYAGIVRGGTQQLVKQELAQHPNDALMDKLDAILDNLQTGTGDYDLVKLNDATYQERLAAQHQAWERLEDDINRFRLNSDDAKAYEQLYSDSESYFVTADATVTAAETYSDGLAQRATMLERWIIADSVVVLILILIRTADALRMARKNRELNDYAYKDSATGLYNKRRCQDQLARTSVLSPSRTSCCMMLDLNNLKLTNDKYGHEAGDHLIERFANVLKKSAPSSMFIGRFGGDEFIGIFDDVRDFEVQEFLGKLESSTKADNAAHPDIPLQFAYGYAFSTGSDVETLQSILDEADRNMYLMKASMKAQAAAGTTTVR